MKTVSQQDRVDAARYFGIETMHAIRHAALRMALFEFHEKSQPDRAKVLRLVDRFHIGDAVGFYASRPEFWRAN